MVRSHHKLNGVLALSKLQEIKDRGNWPAAVHEVKKSQIQLSD